MGNFADGFCLAPFYQLKLDIENLNKKGANENEIASKLKNFLLENYFPCSYDYFFFSFCWFDIFEIFRSQKTLFLVKILTTLYKELNENSDFKKLLEKREKINKDEKKKKEIITQYTKNLSYEHLNEEEIKKYKENIKIVLQTFESRIFDLREIIIAFSSDFIFKLRKFKTSNKFDPELPNFGKINSSWTDDEIKEILENLKEEILASNDKNFLIITHYFIYILNCLLKNERIQLLKDKVKIEEPIIKIDDNYILNNIIWILYEEYNNEKEPNKNYVSKILSRKKNQKKKLNLIY